jgi:hypothetical protein
MHLVNGLTLFIEIIYNLTIFERTKVCQSTLFKTFEPVSDVHRPTPQNELSVEQHRKFNDKHVDH